MAWQAGLGGARRGQARCGPVWQAWRVVVRRGWAGSGEAGAAVPGGARWGKVRHGKAGEAWRGAARRGTVQRGLAWQARPGKV